MYLHLDASRPPVHHFDDSNVLSRCSVVGELWGLPSESLGKLLCLSYIVWKIGMVIIF